MKKYLILVAMMFTFLFYISATKNEVKMMNHQSKFIDTMKIYHDSLKLKDSISKIYEIDFEVKDVVNEVKEYKKAHFSYYGGKFHGRKTASGKVFNKNEFTCAHKTLPFGTKVEIINPKTNTSVVVTVTDRGPYVKGRSFDLSEGAFKKVMNGSNVGTATLNYKILEKNNAVEDLNPVVLKDTLLVKL
jgi:rare lipoprotein A